MDGTGCHFEPGGILDLIQLMQSQTKYHDGYDQGHCFAFRMSAGWMDHCRGSVDVTVYLCIGAYHSWFRLDRQENDDCPVCSDKSPNHEHHGFVCVGFPRRVLPSDGRRFLLAWSPDLPFYSRLLLDEAVLFEFDFNTRASTFRRCFHTNPR